MKKVKFLKLLMFVGLFVMIASTLYINDMSENAEVDQATYIQAFGLVLVLPYIFYHE